MGLRGPGSIRRKTAAAPKKPRRRPEPWKKRGLSRLDRVIAFLEDLPITKGILAGTKLKLREGQREFLAKVYGEGSSARIAVDSEPRGQGKTGLTAGLALCHMIGPESEPRGEVYAASVDRTMSGKLFAEMEAIILARPDFAERVNVKRHEKRMEVLSGDGAGSTFEALSSDARKGHGLAPSLWIYDELAQCDDFELLDNLETGMGKRVRSLGLIISTQAESDDHRLSVMIDEGLAGVDPTIVVHLLAAPANADPFDEAVLRAVNPALGTYLNEKDVLADMRKARWLPAFEPRYRNRRLNQRVDANQDARIVPVGVWEACGAAVDRAALRGRSCWGGLDLSGKHDLTALVLVFPDDDGACDVLPLFWTPEGALATRKHSEANRFKEWIAAGHLIATSGPTIRSGYVAEELAKLAAEFNVEAIAFDRWRIDDLKQDLADIGAKITLQPRGQGFKDQGPDIEVLAECALTGRLRHGGHPVLRAAMSNAITVSDPAGNLKIDKDRSHGRASVRVDGAVALAMALGAAQRTPPKKRSVYASRGVMAVDLSAA
ncbi:MAG TPA: terminase TerL endonuclease subunit [Caulobacterales bacterium]|nr:terminase TerL endonuclease subunit [Caulobacterales bacterium]